MKPGQDVTLPLTRGTGKNPHIGDFVSLMPVNMLAVPPGAALDTGFLRSFPGIIHNSDVAGTSRGALLSIADGNVYRVCGDRVYRNDEAVADITGDDYVSIAASTKSFAIAHDGIMEFFPKNADRSTLSNWPPAQYFPGSSAVLSSGSADQGYDGTINLVQSMTDSGRLQLTIIPKTTTGAVGETLTITDGQYGRYFDQDAPASGTPYLTDVVVSGFKIAGTALSVDYKFNANGSSGDDATSFQWVQIVEPTDVANTQYNLGTVADICHANSRYAWLLKGTNTFGVTDLDDETKPDRYRPFINAEAMTDPAIGIAAQGGMIAVFGTASTEFFTLTGATSATMPIYRSQPGMMVPIGIAGVNCKVLVRDSKGTQQFAVISNPATGAPSVYLVGSGRHTEIASREVIQMLAEIPPYDLPLCSLEYLSYDIHRLLIMRLPGAVLCYDLISRNWCQLCGADESLPHRAIHYIANGAVITVGDTLSAKTGKLDRATAGQYGGRAQHIIYTPLLKADSRRVFDLELETATGTAQEVESLAISATTDGVAYQREVPVIIDGPNRYDIRTRLQRVGFVRKNIGFRFRVLTTTALTISSCHARLL